jgi:hypothetical protein
MMEDSRSAFKATVSVEQHPGQWIHYQVCIGLDTKILLKLGATMAKLMQKESKCLWKHTSKILPSNMTIPTFENPQGKMLPSCTLIMQDLSPFQLANNSHVEYRRLDTTDTLA